MEVTPGDEEHISAGNWEWRGWRGWGRRGEGICISWGVESEPLNADILFFCRLGTSVSESCPPTGGSLRK